MRSSISFAVEDGTTLRGYIYNEGRPGPLIVMTNGFSGVVEQIAHYAEFFSSHGFSALVYDHRGFGISDGMPRQEVDPARQLGDWRDAITFMLGRPETDASAGVGIWGSSFSGGLAFVLAAIDRRVRCVVAQIPNVSGPRNGREMFNEAERSRLSGSFDKDRQARLAGAAPAMMPVFATEPGTLDALPPAVSPRYVEAIQALYPTWINTVTQRSVENMLAFEPAGWIPFIAPTPLMMIVGKNDTCTFARLQL